MFGLKPIHLLLIAFAALGAVILLQKNERAEFQARAQALAEEACATHAESIACQRHAEAEHEDCFLATFDPGSFSKVNQRAASLDGRGYLACVDAGYEEWVTARREQRRQQAKQRREALQ